jgi:hypothetical protein
MKKAKTTKIVKMEKKDSYGNTSFIITLDNGDEGFYTSKSEDQKKFIIGQETEYMIEQKQGAKGFYNKITIPQTENSFTGGGFKGKPAVDPKVQMISFAMAYTKDLIVAGKVPMNDLEKEFKRMYNVMTSLL